MPIVRILLVLLAFASSLPMARGAVAGPFEDAQAAHGRRDYATALRLWRPLADQGNAEAQYALGSMYAGGKGVPKNNTEAAKWWRLAADQGEPRAFGDLGFIYAIGDVVPRNVVSAYLWFDLAVKYGDALAVEHRDALAQEMTPHQIAEARNRASEWAPTSYVRDTVPLRPRET